MQATSVVHRTQTGASFSVTRQSQACGCAHTRTSRPGGQHRYSSVVRCVEHKEA